MKQPQYIYRTPFYSNEALLILKNFVRWCSHRFDITSVGNPDYYNRRTFELVIAAASLTDGQVVIVTDGSNPTEKCWQPGVKLHLAQGEKEYKLWLQDLGIECERSWLNLTFEFGNLFHTYVNWLMRKIYYEDYKPIIEYRGMGVKISGDMLIEMKDYFCKGINPKNETLIGVPADPFTEEAIREGIENYITVLDNYGDPRLNLLTDEFFKNFHRSPFAYILHINSYLLYQVNAICLYDKYTIENFIGA